MTDRDDASRGSEDDTEGQSMAALLAMRELTKSRQQKPKASDEALPPLTKTFPRMREQPKK